MAYRFQLTYPVEGHTIHKSNDIKKIIKKCCNDYRYYNGTEEGVFGITDLNKGVEYQFKVKGSRIRKVEGLALVGGKEQEVCDTLGKLISIVDDEAKGEKIKAECMKSYKQAPSIPPPTPLCPSPCSSPPPPPCSHKPGCATIPKCINETTCNHNPTCSYQPLCMVNEYSNYCSHSPPCINISRCISPCVHIPPCYGAPSCMVERSPPPPPVISRPPPSPPPPLPSRPSSHPPNYCLFL